MLQSGSLTRVELLAGFQRFGVEQRLADTHIKSQEPYLRVSMRGHTRVFEIDWEAATHAEWYSRVERPATVGEMQGCISSSLHLAIEPELTTTQTEADNPYGIPETEELCGLRLESS